MPEDEPGERATLGASTGAGAGRQRQHDLHGNAVDRWSAQTVRWIARTTRATGIKPGEEGKRQRAHDSDRGLVRNEQHHADEVESGQAGVGLDLDDRRRLPSRWRDRGDRADRQALRGEALRAARGLDVSPTFTLVERGVVDEAEAAAADPRPGRRCCRSRGATSRSGMVVVVVELVDVVRLPGWCRGARSCRRSWSSSAPSWWSSCVDVVVVESSGRPLSAVLADARRRGRRAIALVDLAEHLRLHRELRVGDQHHDAAVRVDLGDLADQAGAVGHRHADGDAARWCRR